MGVRSAISAFFGEQKSASISAGGDVPRSPDTGSDRWPALLPSSRINYELEAGDLTQNNAVMACVNWITRTFPEAPLTVMQRQKNKQAQAVLPHKLTTLLETPNPFYDGLLLWQATLLSLNLNGNGYWLLGRNKYKQILEVWYEPHMTIRPVWPNDGSAFISGYQVKRKGRWSDPLPVADVVHFRLGIDPANPRLGLSPLASALREVFTDNEAANYSASILRNMGIPGLVISPADSSFTIEEDEADVIKQRTSAHFGGDRRGSTMVMQGPTKVEVLAWSPDQLNLDKLRSIPEERITALLGLPAIVAGLGAGLDHGTYNNTSEAKASGYEGNLLPTQRLLASKLRAQLLPELGNPKTEFLQFDTSQVQALSEDKDKRYQRISVGFKAGWLKRADARMLSGETLEIDDERDDVYITDLIVKGAKLQETEPAGTLLHEDGDEDEETDDSEDDGTDLDKQLDDATNPDKGKKSARHPVSTEGKTGARQLNSAFTSLMDELEAAT
jgi:HK97 family phage portal protein